MMSRRMFSGSEDDGHYPNKEINMEDKDGL